MPRPVIVVEVLSDSTARKDRTVKLDGYFAVPTIEHLSARRLGGARYHRHRPEGSGLTKPVIVRDGSLMFDPPGLAVDISKVFQDN